jgi:hypothetical protein
MVEEFFVRRRLGFENSIGVERMSARRADAFLILRDEMEREEWDGKTHN